MANKQEAAVRQFCSAFGDGSRQVPDKEQILSLMAPDAEWTLWVPGGSVQRGLEAISAEIDRQAPMMQFLECRIRSMASSGNTVFTERTDHFVFMGKPITHPVVAIFELDADDRVRGWREYFDTAWVATSMGIDPAAINAEQ